MIDLSAHTDDTGGDQLLDSCPDGGVLHVVLQRGWVAFGLLENALHDGILEDTEYL